MPSIGSSIFLIAVGAILRYAVTASVEGVSLQTVGLILMIVGIVGLFISLLYFFAWSPWHNRPRKRVVEERDPAYDRPTRTY